MIMASFLVHLNALDRGATLHNIYRLSIITASLLVHWNTLDCGATLHK